MNGNWDTSTNNWLFNAAPDKFQALDMVVMDDSATGATAITLNAAVTPLSVAVNNSAKNYSVTGTGSIGGSGPLYKSGSGSLTLATINSYTGGTYLNAGTLQLGDGTTNGSVVGNIVNNASLVLNNASAVTTSGLVSGTGSLTKLGAGTFALTTAPTYTGPTTIGAGTLQVPAFASTSAIVNNSALVFNRLDTALVNPSPAITGSGSVSYTGPAVATSLAAQYAVDDANTYAGPTTIVNARTNVSNAAGFSSGAITVLSGGQVYGAGPVGMVISNPITINGIGWPESAGNLGAIRLNNNTTLTGPITLGSDSRISSYSNYGTITSVISGGFNMEYTATGNTQNTITLSGSASNTYTGLTSVSSGVLVLAKTGGALAIPGNLVIGNVGYGSVWGTTNNQIGGSGALVFTGASGNGRFQLMGMTHTFAGLSNEASANLTAVVQNSEPPWSGLNYDTGTLVLNVAAGQSYSFTNGYVRNANGVLALVKNGLGSQLLSREQVAYSGTTTINAGTFILQDTTAFVSPTMVAAGASLNLVRTALGLAGKNRIGGLISGTGTININNSGTGLAGGWTTFNSAANGLKDFSGVLNVNSGVLSTDNRAGAWTNSYPTTNVSAGALFAIRAQNNVTLGGLNGAGDVFSSWNGDGAAGNTVTLGGANASGAFSGGIHGSVASGGTDGTIEQGILNLVKIGTGTQTLSGVNTYAGYTTISGGSLVLTGTGSINATSALTIASGAVLDVSATTSGLLTRSSAQPFTGGRTSGTGSDLIGKVTTAGTVNVAGTGAFGTLTVSSDLTFSGGTGGILQMDFSTTAAAGSDKIVSGGAITLGGITTVTPIFYGVPDTTTPYTLMTGTSVTGDAATALTGLIPSSRYSLAFDSTTVPNSVLMKVSGTGANLVWSGAAASVWKADTALLNWNADVDYFQNLDAVTFDDTEANGAVALTTTVSPASILVNANTTAYTISGTGGVIAGGAKLTKMGTQTLTLSTANIYGGGTLISQGQISSGNGSSVGIGTVTLGDEATLANNVAFLSTAAQTINNNIVVSASGSGTVTLGAVTGTGGLHLYNGSVTLNRATTMNASTDRTTFDGKISGNVGTITIAGTANQRVSFGNPANDFVGNIVVNAGAVFQNGGPGGTIPDATNMTVNGTFKLNTGSTNETVGGINGAATGIVQNHEGVGGTPTLTVGFGDQSGTFAGALNNGSGILSLVKIGTGTQTLGGAGNMGGTTRLLGGTLAITHLSALAGSTLVWNNEGGALDWSTLTTGTLKLGGLRGAQDLTLNGLSLSLGLGTNSNTDVYTGTLKLVGAGLGFTKAGPSNLTLGGSVSNEYSGPTTFISGAIAPDVAYTCNGTTQGSTYLAKTGGAVAIPAGSAVTFGIGAAGTAGQINLRPVYDNQFGAGVVITTNNASGNWCRFDLGGTSQTIAGINTGSLAAAGGGIIQNIGLNGWGNPAPGKLTLDGAGTYVFQGYLRDSDAGGNATRQLHIVKNGVGSQTFLGANLTGLTGDTTVNAGTLVYAGTTSSTNYVVNGGILNFSANQTNTTAVINSGGKLTLTGGGGGTGTIRNTVTVNAGGELSSTVVNAFGWGGGTKVNTLNINGGLVTTSADGDQGWGVTINMTGGTLASTGLGRYSMGGGMVVNVLSSPDTATISGVLRTREGNLNNAIPFNVADGPQATDLLVSGAIIPQTGGVGIAKSGAGKMVLSGLNTYTGSTVVNAGTLELADNAQLKFVLGATSGTTATTLTGAGTAVLNGDFVIDTAAAAALTAGSWTLENVTSLTGAYGSTFSVVGFMDCGSNSWAKFEGTKVWSFNETTGTLSLAPLSFASWIGAYFPGVTDPAIIGAGADPDKDGLPNAVEMVLGGNPATGMDAALLPTLELVNADPDGDTVMADYLLFTYRRSDLSVTGNVTAGCETSTALLSSWVPAVGAAGVVILTDDNYASFVPPAANTDRVRVFVPRGADPMVFGRLNVSVP